MMHEKRKQENVEQLRAQNHIATNNQRMSKIYHFFFNNCIFIEPKLFEIVWQFYAFYVFILC